MRFPAIIFVTCGVFVAGCSVKLTFPSGANISCNKTTDCPSGYACSANHCVVPTGKSCHENADCYDDNYCKGIETCVQGQCTTGAPPCQNTPSCMLSTCTLTGPGTVTCGTPEPSDATCGLGMYCDQVSGCLSCSTLDRCGWSCLACVATSTTPICGGVDTGCACDPSPAPNGSCGTGRTCSNDVCVTCDTTNAGGPSCVICSGNTPACGGAVAGCIVDSTIDPSTGGCVNQPDFTPCQVAQSPYWYAICANGNCVSPGCFACSAGTCNPKATPDATCNTPGPGYAQAGLTTGWKNPDTDQQTCKDGGAELTNCEISCTKPPCAPCGGSETCLTVSDQPAIANCGQDAQYGWDTTNPESTRYTAATGTDENPVVSDNITGLMWQGCVAGLSGNVCSAGLGASKGTWTTALQYCNDLTWAGYSDWRLPDLFELLSIVDYGPNNFSTDYFSSSNFAIDLSAFPATPATHFWASTTGYDAKGNFGAWYVHFYFGAADYADMSNAYYARCVRGVPLSQNVVQHFSRTVPANNQPIVADNRTGLVWQGCAAGTTGDATETACSGTAGKYTWQNALAYCGGLKWGGYGDWRLPSVKEIVTILYPLNKNPAIDTANFPSTPSDNFWTSTSYIGATCGNAWGVDFQDGNISPSFGVTENPLYVRCVRGGP